ncbi:uncharacterized protein LOC131241109 isoform X1 [Magnolia sinica]|uniref:uncharacterized protein LOC131241109 isoform X1 n=1 Tax=Magnolia sinica TaxID=86752 RepID=UPI00265B1487|nr:uncharacterized protein LOC131241109 isoform X1 [Magnolia sinica]
MEMCYNNGSNSCSSSSSSNSVDSSNNRLMMGRQTRYSPLSVNAILGPAFNACIHPQNALDADSSLHYCRSSAEVLLPPAMDSGQLLRPRPRYRLRSLSSSRGSSPSPLSPIENLPTPPPRSPPVYKATPPPVKVVEGEEVLVMDGILVNSSSPVGMNRAATVRSSADSSVLSGSNSLYKTEICRSWEDSGTCRYGTKCQHACPCCSEGWIRNFEQKSVFSALHLQFAHGKEELRPARHPKNKSEGQICKSFATTGACMFGTKCRYAHQALAAATTFGTEAEEMVNSVLQVGPELAEAYINHILYGPRRRPRLPVFLEICRE